MIKIQSYGELTQMIDYQLFDYYDVKKKVKITAMNGQNILMVFSPVAKKNKIEDMQEN